MLHQYVSSGNSVESKLDLKPCRQMLFQCKAVNLRAISSRRETTLRLSGFVLAGSRVLESLCLLPIARDVLDA